ncbi:META domain-containing protein [Novosphingopyxis sp.]|uniref:META domain-containing protein n=1 Tax=Novosphingopyxis sp. TaxID=2709690 RepID=UPI003B5B0B4F
MRYDGADGGRYTIPTPPASPSFNGLRYVAEAMTVDVTYSECSDGMSDRRFHDTVTVQLPDGRDLSGCGGSILPPQDLAGTSWRMLDVNGLPVESTDAVLRFDGQTVSGSTGCNRFSADYAIDGMAVSFGPARSTRMACAPGTMGQERALLDLLAAAEAQPVGDRVRRLGAIRYAPNGNMILTAPEGRVAVLSQVF